jgi:hypothetical protein
MQSGLDVQRKSKGVPGDRCPVSHLVLSGVVVGRLQPDVLHLGAPLSAIRLMPMAARAPAKKDCIDVSKRAD